MCCIIIFLKQGFKVAYVVYKELKSLKTAMQMEWEMYTFSTEENPIKTGLESNFESVIASYGFLTNFLQFFGRVDCRLCNIFH